MFLNHRPIFLLFVLFLNSFTIIFSLTFAQESFWVKVHPTVKDLSNINVYIETNISEEITASVSLALDGQKPDDVFIGTDMVRVRIKNGKGHTTIDGHEHVYPVGSSLPTGTYNVEVNIYPSWKENKEVATLIGLKKNLEGKAKIRLSASGESSEAVSRKAEGRQWVMENVYMGKAWNPKTWKKKFGNWEVVKYSGEGNPDILKMYFFKQIDMTLMINILKQEIVTYRNGRSSE